jgi:hypothetical protein
VAVELAALVLELAQAVVREAVEAGQEQGLLGLALGRKGWALEDQVQAQVRVRAVLEQASLGQEAAVAVRVMGAGPVQAAAVRVRVQAPAALAQPAQEVDPVQVEAAVVLVQVRFQVALDLEAAQNN